MPALDTAEQVYISSLALLKVCAHSSNSLVTQFSLVDGGGGVDAETRTRWRPNGGDGPHAGRVRGRLHGARHRRVRHAAVGHRALPFLSPECSSSSPCVLSLVPVPVACALDVQGVSVEAVDPVFQAKMLDMLKQTGR